MESFCHVLPNRKAPWEKTPISTRAMACAMEARVTCRLACCPQRHSPACSHSSHQGSTQRCHPVHKNKAQLRWQSSATKEVIFASLIAFAASGIVHTLFLWLQSDKCSTRQTNKGEIKSGTLEACQLFPGDGHSNMPWRVFGGQGKHCPPDRALNAEYSAVGRPAVCFSLGQYTASAANTHREEMPTFQLTSTQGSRTSTPCLSADHRQHRSGPLLLIGEVF